LCPGKVLCIGWIANAANVWSIRPICCTTLVTVILQWQLETKKRYYRLLKLRSPMGSINHIISGPAKCRCGKAVGPGKYPCPKNNRISHHHPKKGTWAHRNFKNFLWFKSESSGSVTHGSPHRARGYQTLHSTALKSGGSLFFKIQECVRCSGIFHRSHCILYFRETKKSHFGINSKRYVTLSCTVSSW
jgi:hypothetical protein